MIIPNRNAPCPCGSSKKYKQCCLRRDELLAAQNKAALDLISRDFQSALEHHQSGRLAQAEAFYRKILQLDPSHTDALHLLGLIAHQTGKSDIAVELIGKAIGIRPSEPIYYYNRGAALAAQGRLDEAIDHYRQALALKPDYAEAYYNFGNALAAQGKQDEAVERYRTAISLRPNYAEAHNNLGTALKNLGELATAAKHFQKALFLQPDYADAHNNMGVVSRHLGQLDEAIRHYRRALSLRPDNVDSYSNLLFLFAYNASLTPHDYLVEARNWERCCLTMQERQVAKNRIFQRTPLAGRRLKVGYVSGDFRQHAVSYFVTQLFAQHDKTRIELFAYSTHGQQDTVTEQLQALVEHWTLIKHIPDAAIRDRIEADGIDVLIDLSGHTDHNCLGVFAHRAAPVQAHYLGFMASTGLTEMDYWIGDKTLTPTETDNHFSEQVWRLPRVWVSYEGKIDAPLPDWQPSQDGTIWVGSFNNLGKLTPATLALWAHVLHALPEGKLLLKTKELADTYNRQRILDVMANHGITSERIELQDSNATPDWAAHMAYYNRLDIALDPVGGIGGGTTTCDTLWMGVPIITLEGDRMASRITATILNAIDHKEWIVHSEAEYIAKVIALARNFAQRKTLRFTQREQMAKSQMCNAHHLAMSLENAYSEMFERWHNNQEQNSCAISQVKM